MANDNTLGAPTEGLGQTVTFTAAGAQAPQARGAQRGSLRAGTQGDGRANLTNRSVGIQDAREGEAVLNVFRKLGNDILAPRLEAARNDAFLTGMQRAAGGEAITEIVNEQPWYSQVFGETPVVEGARVWSAHSKAQAELQALEGDMVNLRAKSPTEIKNLLNQRLAAVKTGDRGTDALVTQALLDELPSFAKRHTKEHIAYQQATYATDFRNSQFAAAARYASTRAAYDPDPAGKPKALLEGRPVGSVTDPGDMIQAEGVFVSSFIKPVDMPQDTYDTLTTGTLMGMLSQGNLHAYYALEDNQIITTGLSVESQIKLQNALDRAETKAQSNLPLSIIDEIAKIKALPSQSDLREVDGEINERVAKVTAAYTAATGSRKPPISGTTLIELKNSMIENHAQGIRRAHEAWAKAGAASTKAGEKEAEELNAARKAAAILLEGRSTAGLKDEQVRAGWQVLRDENPEGLRHARRIGVLQTEVDKVGQNLIKQDAKKNFDTANVDGWHKLYVDEYLPLSRPGDSSAAKAYFGDYYDDMAYYAQSLAGMDPRKVEPPVAGAAFERMKIPRRAPVGTAEDRKKIKEALLSVAENIHPSGLVFGRYDLRDDQADLLRQRLHTEINSMGDHLTIKERTKVALQQAKAEGLELAGGYFWERPPGAPSFLSALNAFGDKPPTDTLNAAVAGTVQKFITKLDLDPKEHVVHYQLNGQVPRLAILAKHNKDGIWRQYPIELQDVHDTFKEGPSLFPQGLTPTGRDTPKPGPQPDFVPPQTPTGRSTPTPTGR